LRIIMYTPTRSAEIERIKNVLKDSRFGGDIIAPR